MEELVLLRSQLETVQEENKRLKQRFLLENGQLKEQLQFLMREVTHLQEIIGQNQLAPTVVPVTPQASEKKEVGVQCQLDSSYQKNASPSSARVLLSSPQHDNRQNLTAAPCTVDVQALSKEADRLVTVINKLRGERLSSPSHSSSAVAAASAQALPTLLSPH